MTIKHVTFIIHHQIAVTNFYINILCRTQKNETKKFNKFINKIVNK